MSAVQVCTKYKKVGGSRGMLPQKMGCSSEPTQPPLPAWGPEYGTYIS